MTNPWIRNRRSSPHRGDLPPGLPLFPPASFPTSWLPIALLLILCAPGCDNSPQGPEALPQKPVSPEGAPLNVPVTTNTPDEPDFQGLAGAWAGEDFVELFWLPAGDANHPSEKIRYLIYMADESGKHDEVPPYARTARGETRIRLTGLQRGKTRYFVVHALDHHGHEDTNDVELNATPNPVLYVNGSAAAAGDGSSPATPCLDFQGVKEQTISLIGVNVHVAAGDYAGPVFLFEGMMLYGGFSSDFSSRDPDAHTTVLKTQRQSKLVIAPPSEIGLYSGLDGFRLIGNPQEQATARVGEVGIDATDCKIQLSNLEIRDFISSGVELTSEDPEKPIEGTMLRCRVVDNRGEGIRLEGYLDYRIAYSEIRGNQNEGVEIRMETFRDEKSKVEFEFCHISENRSPGLDARIFTNEEEPGGRARIDLSGCFFENNSDIGANVDVRFNDDDGVDFQARIEGNTFTKNAREGLHCDLDATGDVRIANNKFSDNAIGLVIDGSSDSIVCRVLNDCYRNNQGNGIEVRNSIPLWIRHSEFVGNDGAAIDSVAGAWVDASGSWFEGNEALSSLHRLSYCVVDENIEAAYRGPEVWLRKSSDDSPSIDVHDRGPLGLFDADKTRADLGPLGGPAAATPGTYAKRGRPIELIAATPTPGTFIDQARWTLSFSETDIDTSGIEVRVNGQRQDAAVSGVKERIAVELRTPPPVGSLVTLRLTPRKKLVWPLDLPYTMATRLSQPGEVSAVAPAFGEFQLTHTQREHRFSISAMGSSNCLRRIRVRLRDSDRHDQFVVEFMGGISQPIHKSGDSRWWTIDLPPTSTTPAQLTLRCVAEAPFDPLIYSIEFHAAEKSS